MIASVCVSEAPLSAWAALPGQATAERRSTPARSRRLHSPRTPSFQPLGASLPRLVGGLRLHRCVRCRHPKRRFWCASRACSHPTQILGEPSETPDRAMGTGPRVRSAHWLVRAITPANQPHLGAPPTTINGAPQFSHAQSAKRHLTGRAAALKFSQHRCKAAARAMCAALYGPDRAAALLRGFVIGEPARA
jgi:hypothetical protein